jgi:hypothetical protein
MMFVSEQLLGVKPSQIFVLNNAINSGTHQLHSQSIIHHTRVLSHPKSKKSRILWPKEWELSSLVVVESAKGSHGGHASLRQITTVWRYLVVARVIARMFSTPKESLECEVISGAVRTVIVLLIVLSSL